MVYLLLNLAHKLTFDEVSLGSLTSSDTSIRGTIRHWLHLPKDAPIPFYHGPVKSGGLGILQLREWVPRLRIRRLTEIFSETGHRKDELMTNCLRDNTPITRKFQSLGRRWQSNQNMTGERQENFYNIKDLFPRELE